MSSREKILSQVKSALRTKSHEEESKINIDELLKSKINLTVKTDKNDLISQFQTELKKVNGDSIVVKSNLEASNKINEILIEVKENQIAITDQNICTEVRLNIQKGNSNLQFIIANNLDSKERKEKISQLKTAIVQADYAVSEIAQLVFLYDNSKTSYPHFLCDFVIALVKVSNLMPNQFTLFEKIDKVKALNMVLVTGPSRTADIEKVLVLGAHGPRKLIVILIDE